jgi:hypothetical protein
VKAHTNLKTLAATNLGGNPIPGVPHSSPKIKRAEASSFILLMGIFRNGPLGT